MKSDRLRWAVENDRKDLANYESDRRSDCDSGSEQEALAERVLKNLALIRAYEAKADDKVD
ncbi:hypothetical protein [Bradyrhizobium iriomotense]|uniref:Uncharacterized protein n=1 Tax=Bradyrhizobium iriomotense TaxID=441950 RepID=A0ABQ6BGZ3_9BRAD|nr:hypothetical protein [Bradyrhizobium iriomotense]GLR91373.1 hypothetical protein GCM10007857_80900 [Bradyrhizobium iriomotense]